MNLKKTTSYLLALLVVFGTFLFFYFRNKPEASRNDEPSGMIDSVQFSGAKTSLLQKVEPSMAATNENSKLSNAHRKAHALRVLEDIQSDWKTPINFYGKVVDENGQPVEKVSVQFMWNDLSAKGTSESTATSDTQGIFSITEKKGKRLYVKVEKPGYYTSLKKDQTSFEYANEFESIYHIPDPNNPVIFHLKSKGKAEPLIQRYVKVPLSSDGPAARFDFNLGTVSDSGQFEVQVWRSDEREPTNRKFDWRVTITMHGGGLLETNEEFPFIAPEGDYRESVEFDSVVQSDSWTAGTRKQLFAYFGEPRKYLRINIRLRTTGMQYYMDYWLNPSGSRNLEYDVSVQLKPKFLE